MTASIDELGLRTTVGEVLNRWPTAGLAVGVVGLGTSTWLDAHGVADVVSNTPVSADTVFRIGSITKTMTAVAVLQLWEQGLVDLDAQASDYLRGCDLVPARASFRPVTVRHLLTHTGGVRAVRTAADLLRPTLGWGVRVGHRMPPLAQYYRGGMRVDVDPGTRWAYSNHGFTLLGQLVQDVTGVPFDRYLRERVFEPLGMDTTDLVRSARVRQRLATGYVLRSAGLREVTDREVVTAGAGAAYSSARDLARWVGALLGGGANEHGSVLAPATVQLMFEPHYQPDPRIPGMGLGVFLDEVGGLRTVGHDGIWTGFHSAMLLAPDAGIGVLALANTGQFGPVGVTGPAVTAMLRQVLGVGEDAVAPDVPQDPRVWGELCGWYSFGPGVLTDPQPRAALGAGVEIVVRRGQLIIRGQTPVPAVRRGLRLHPEPGDPSAFRIDVSGLGAGTAAVVFSRGPGGGVAAVHTFLGSQPISFKKRPNRGNPRPWASAAVMAGAAGAVLARRRH